tara:strand:- start:137 stop:637 length:501 start_codon:yes stop_codon:yes gene_type:complete
MLSAEQLQLLMVWIRQGYVTGEDKKSLSALVESLVNDYPCRLHLVQGSIDALREVKHSLSDEEYWDVCLDFHAIMARLVGQLNSILNEWRLAKKLVIESRKLPKGYPGGHRRIRVFATRMDECRYLMAEDMLGKREPSLERLLAQVNATTANLEDSPEAMKGGASC